LFSGSNRFNTRLNPRCFNDRRAAEVVHPSSVTKAEEKAKPKYVLEGQIGWFRKGDGED